MKLATIGITGTVFNDGKTLIDTHKIVKARFSGTKGPRQDGPRCLLIQQLRTAGPFDQLSTNVDFDLA